MNTYQPNDSSSSAIRLSKRVMGLTGCSRMQAERLIDQGHVQVDGIVTQSIPTRVQPHQKVEVTQSLLAQSHSTALTLLLHKPADVNMHDALQQLGQPQRWAQDRVTTQVSPQSKAKLQTLTPIEDGAQGLVVWSLDPAICKRFDGRSTPLEHEVLAQISSDMPAQDVIAQLQQASPTPSAAWSPARISLNQAQTGTVHARFALKGYTPGEIWARCQQAQLNLQTMRRIRIGQLALGTLPVGQWRLLQPFERF